MRGSRGLRSRGRSEVGWGGVDVHGMNNGEWMDGWDFFNTYSGREEQVG